MDGITDMAKFLSLESPQYVVRGDDTLEKISDKTGICMQTLRKINKIFDNRNIHEGQVLKLQIPADAVSSSSSSSSSSPSSSCLSKAVAGDNDSEKANIASVFNLPSTTNTTDESPTSGEGNSSSSSVMAAARKCQSEDDLVARAGLGIGSVRKDPLLAAYESNYELSEVLIDNNFISQILNPKKLTLINAYLPVLHQCESWTLLYSLYEHGADFGTFYHRIEGYQKTIIVVQTDTNEIFGGYATGEWRINPHNFGGTGQSFLFKFSNDALQHFGWTECNEFFMRCAEDQIAMGGGGDGFGFVLDKDFITGGSCRCATFDNEPLTTSSTGTFKIINVEIYGFASSLKKGYKRR